MSAPEESTAPRAGPPGWPNRAWVGPSLFALMTIHLILVGHQIQGSTPTVDEIAHLPAGFSYLDRGTFAIYRLSPPLVRLLGAATAWPSKPRLTYERSWALDQPANHWRFAFETIAVNAETPADRERYLQSFTLARLAIAVWSALTIPVLYLWGRDWYGPAGGMLSATLWTLSPNILAHAGLFTTDLAATSAGLIATYTLFRWIDRPQWFRWSLAALALGAAQLIKFSSLWLYPLFVCWLCVDGLIRRDGRFVRRLAGLVAIYLTSIVTINLGYLFEGTGTRLGEFPFLSESLTRPRTSGDPSGPATNNRTYQQVWQQRTNRFQGTFLGSLYCPLPYHYVAGFDEQKFEAEGKYPMYLRGQFADPIAETPADEPEGRRGWWYYYLYALAIKVPLSTWFLVGLGVLSSGRGSHRVCVATFALLAAVPVVVMSFLTDINLGLRYVLPAMPYFFLIAGSAVAVGRARWCRWLAGAGIGWNVVALLGIHPHELSYFNESVGGPTQGRFHLIDSNIDWGQDLRRLARWQNAHPDWLEVKLAYMGSVPPEFEGIDRFALAPRDIRRIPDRDLLPWEKRDDPTTWGPLPGKYVVSVNFERGMRFHTPAPIDDFIRHRGKLGGSLLSGSAMINIPRNSYAYFQHLNGEFRPEIGYSLILFDVTKQEANRVRSELGMPALP